ncbi:MAG: hypothetical protein JRI70_07755 [Deltaproteobacteria bacterium]|nr:hypothetical protein [Deltaproteobacteria bacterium]
MNETKILSILVIAVFVIGGHTNLAVAGTEPLPFQQLSAISLDVKITGKYLDEILNMPVCRSSPRQVRRAVLDLHDITFRLAGFSALIRRSPFPSLPLEGDDPTPIQLKGRVKSIIRSIDEYQPDPCAPDEFIGAVFNVRDQAVTLLKNVKRYIRFIKALIELKVQTCVDDPDCGCVGTATPCAGLDQVSCIRQSGCNWDDTRGIDPFCAGTAEPCSAINATACGSQDGCSNASCIGGLCFQTPHCYVNSDCPEGQECIFGFCSPEDFPPPIPGTCDVDSDCPEGSYCLFSICVPDNAPIPSFCVKDLDCPPGLRCFFNICLPF